MKPSSLAAVVITLNEAEHLPDCLASLAPLTRNIRVLDSGSSDATVAIAREAGARVTTRAFDGYATQRNAALDLAGDAEWIFFLDADERLNAAGAAEIHDRLDSAADDVAAFWLPRRNIVFGRELRGGGWWPDWQARLLRRGRSRYDNRRQVHEVVVIDGASECLSEPIVHLNYATRREFFAKQRAYTLQRARERHDPAAIPRRRSYLSAPAREFVRRFVTLRGYRDGGTGLFLASVMALEEVRACRLRRSGARS